MKKDFIPGTCVQVGRVRQNGVSRESRERKAFLIFAAVRVQLSLVLSSVSQMASGFLGYEVLKAARYLLSTVSLSLPHFIFFNRFMW